MKCMASSLSPGQSGAWHRFREQEYLLHLILVLARNCCRQGASAGLSAGMCSAALGPERSGAGAEQRRRAYSRKKLVDARLSAGLRSGRQGRLHTLKPFDHRRANVFDCRIRSFVSCAVMATDILPVEEEDVEEPNASYAAALEEIKQRCAAHKVEYEQTSSDDGTPFATIKLPSGKETRNVLIGSEKKANRVLKVPFEEYSFVPGFEAICSYKKGLIEASIRPLSSVPPSIVTRLFGRDDTDPSATKEIIVGPPHHSANQPILRIGTPSIEIQTLLTGIGPRYPGLSLTINNVSINQGDMVTRILSRYADSIFFQIELIHNNTFILERERRRRVIARNIRHHDEPLPVEYPRNAFDAPAISLYWYGRGARGMPLLQFLAFYQVVEFYYPRYSNLEARKRLTSILKDPTFRSDRDEHVDKLISSIVINRSGAIGDERSQLRSVINNCLNADELRNFLQSDPEREAHVSGKNSKAKLHKVPLQNKSLDVRNDVSDRIYDIRCKIVHTKND
jgi:hypothetical protein